MNGTKDKLEYTQCSVAIVGGGPSGIATALTLTALGISNCVVEASVSPNQKFGEALPPNSKPILNQLGLQTLVEDDHHVKYYGNKSCWGTDRLEQKDFITDIHGHGYLLDRTYFEKQLWDCYLASGGALLNGYKYQSTSPIENDHSIIVQNKEQKINIRCQYIVDATGRKASVCRQLGFTKIKLDAQFALSFTVKTEKPLERQILVEATKNGWWYAAPNPEFGITIMFFTLRKLIPEKSKRIDFLKEQLTSTIHISSIISPSSISGTDVKIMPAGTSRLAIPYGENWIAVGDAAVSFDPTSSYGITSALASGYYAGQAIASKLAGKQEAMDAYRYIVENAFQAYQEKLDLHYKTEQRWMQSYYWNNRFSLGMR